MINKQIACTNNNLLNLLYTYINILYICPNIWMITQMCETYANFPFTSGVNYG